MKTIVIDGIFFQLNEWSGIARFWRTLLNDLDRKLEDVESLRIFVLARGSSTTLRGDQFQHIQILPVAYFDPLCALSDYKELSYICRALEADVFISSYYTLAYGVANIGIAYDFIPEAMGWMNNHIWKLKEIYMRSLRHCLSISRSTAYCAELYYPNLTSDNKDIFYPPITKGETRTIAKAEINQLRQSHGLNYPYVAVVGHRYDYKNVNLLMRALETRPSYSSKISLGVVATSGEALTDQEMELFQQHFQFGIRRVELDSTDMPTFLNAAEVLFYPSLLEGFGYPIAEALAQQCPVITTGATSISEILEYAESEDYKLISGHDEKEALLAIIDITNKRQRASATTAARISQAFGKVDALAFVHRLLTLSEAIAPPLEPELPGLLAIDGLLA